MATFQAPNFTFSPLTTSSKSRIHIIKSALQFPDLTRLSSSTSHNLPKNTRFVVDEINQFISTKRLNKNNDVISDDVAVSKMQAILEAVSDRIEMHNNIKEQRDNWATLLLNSTNMITLTATLAAALASAVGHNGLSSLGLKLTSVVLFTSAAGIMALVNKIQPCQLVEEQRNSIRQFKHLRTRIQSRVGSGRVTESDVADAMERVLAIDRAYPLPLLGAMLDKFPENFSPARWWPAAPRRQQRSWSEGMKEEMKEIVKVVKNKDLEDYERLGSKALKISKALAVAGPVLTGMAAAAAGFNMPVVAGVCGALATVANTVEHGGQVGMVLEMYRNCAGFFKQLEDDVAEGDVESEEVFELKMALRLGRSVTELRDLAAESKRRRGSVDEFACNLF